MEQHVTLVAILNIVYRAWTAAWGLLLFALWASFDAVIDLLHYEFHVSFHDVPPILFDIVPFVLLGMSLLVLLVSAAGIVGGAATLRRMEWGRILLLLVSFFTLFRIPVGTVLAGYTMWALLSAESVRLFRRP